MLSKQERNYLMFEKDFRERYGENYCKKIRNSIRKKIIQMGIDLFLIDRFEDKWLNGKENRKSLSSFILDFLADFIRSGKVILSKKREQERESRMLIAIRYSILHNKYKPKNFIADSNTTKKLEKALINERKLRG